MLSWPHEEGNRDRCEPNGGCAGLQDVVDEARIRALHADYVDAVNRQAWEEFEDLFLPDAHLTVVKGDASPDEVTGPGAIGALIAGYVSVYDFLIQVVLNARIRVRQEGDPDRAFARLYIAEFRQVTHERPGHRVGRHLSRRVPAA